MKEFFRNLASAALVAALALGTYCAPADAQTVTQLPAYVDQGGPRDFGNGPIELKIVQGNAIFTTSQGFGVISSVSGTLITLTATPTSTPCIINGTIATNTVLNCAIGGGGITAGTLVGSYNVSTGTGTGTGPSIGIPTGINNTAVNAGQPIGWGAACPASPPAGVTLQASVGGDFPFYTYARVCAYQQFGPGALVMPFAIGAH